MKKWLLRMLKQPSTWKGVVLIASALGLTLSPDQAQSIVAALVAIIGAIETFRDEDKPMFEK